MNNYPGYSARNPQTGKLFWLFALAIESETTSTKLSVHENEQLDVNEILNSLN